MPGSDVRSHEITLCGRVKSWAEALFKERPDLPYSRVEIEESKARNRTRSDLRLYDRKGGIVACGEVKLPGTVEGRSAYNFALIADAATKAANAGAEFFLTWNVNSLVLFDCEKWHLPPAQRQVRDYDLGLNLDRREDVDRPEVEARLREFLGQFFGDLAAIQSGAMGDWAQPLDAFFIRAFESHLGWPAKLAAAHLQQRADADRAFDARLQEWMAHEQGWAVVRHDANEWRRLADRAARTLCYVFANRLLFYESVRAKFKLPELRLPRTVAEPVAMYAHFQRVFQTAVEATGDYETLFYP